MITISELSKELDVSNETLLFFLKEKYPKLKIENSCREGTWLFPESNLTEIKKTLKDFFNVHIENETTHTKDAVVWYWKAANRGDKDAQKKLKEAHPASLRILGDCLFEGRNGVPPNRTEAVVWYWKAANQEDSLANIYLNGRVEVQRILGDCFFNGTGVPKNEKSAVEWYRKAADAGNAEAQRILGDCFFYGTGVSRDEDEARRWYHLAAENGDAEAKRIFYNRFFNGNNADTQERKEAVVELWRRMSQGDVTREKLERQTDSVSWRILGDCLFEGRDGVLENKAEAVVWYWKAANSGEGLAKVYIKRPEVLSLLADCLWKGTKCVPRDEKSALVLYWEAMKRGHDWAKIFLEEVAPEFQRILGICLFNGDSGASRNGIEAAFWYRKAAEARDVEAMCLLADYLIKIPQYKAEAAYWYWKAKNKEKLKDSEIQRLLAGCFFRGVGGASQNKKNAVCWYRKAAEAGDAEAMRFLGDCFFEGWGVAQDRQKAIDWYRKAVEGGDVAARSLLAAAENEARPRYYDCYYNGYDVGVM